MTDVADTREPGSGRPLQVLLVDDDAELLRLVELVLSRAGTYVLTAGDGRRALTALEFFRPDVIVTDLMMPELDGLAFMREYASRPVDHAPIIAVSGFAPYLEEARRLGAVATLQKPYRPEELAALIADTAAGRTPSPAQTRPPPPNFDDEDRRLRAVLELRLTEPDPELGLQRFLDEVAALFGVPVAGISALTQTQQRLVVHCSLVPPDPGGPREQSFCTHAVAARAALVIQDALENPLFRDNPSVTERGFRFYAGVPLMASQGDAVGTLCVLDSEPHRFSYVDMEMLGLFAQRVLAAFEWRDKRTRAGVPDSAYRYLHCLDEQLGIYGKALFGDLVVLEASRAIQERVPVALVAVAVPPERLEQVSSALREVSGGLVGRLGLARLGVIARGKKAAEAQMLVRRCAGDVVEIAATDLNLYQGATGRALFHVEQALGSAGLS